METFSKEDILKNKSQINIYVNKKNNELELCHQYFIGNKLIDTQFSTNFDYLNDEDIIFAFISFFGNKPEFIGKKLMNNKEFLIKLFKYINIDINLYKSYFLLLSRVIKSDKEFVSALFDINIDSIRYLYSFIRTDNEFVMSLIDKNYRCIQYMPDKLKDKKVVMFAMKHKKDKQIPSYVKTEYSKDKNFLIELLFVLYKNNNLLNKLKQNYYEEYKKNSIRLETASFDLFDFINYIIHSEELEKIYTNDFYSVLDVNVMESIIFKTDFYNIKEQELIKLKISKYKLTAQSYGVKFYNDVVLCKEKNGKLEKVLNKYNLELNNVETAIIDSKCLDSKMKTSLCNLIYNYKNEEVMATPIVNILYEAHTRKISVNKLLIEKSFSMQIFKKLFNKALLNNSFLANYVDKDEIDESIVTWKKVILLSEKILNSNFNSLEEYNTLFKSSYKAILAKTINTDYYDLLYNKFKNAFGTEFDYEGRNDGTRKLK